MASGGAGAAAGFQVIVMSDSGKPIFSYHHHHHHRHQQQSDDNDDDAGGDVARICGLVQAVRASLLYGSSASSLGGGGGDLQSLQSRRTRAVFLTVGSITLVAIAKNGSSNENNSSTSTEFYLRLQLEYVYAQIIFALTDQVQTMLAQNASLDLQSMLSASSLRSILQKTSIEQQQQRDNNSSSSSSSSSSNDPAPFVLAAVPVLFPLSPAVREQASQVLKQVGDQTPNTVFALLLLRAGGSDDDRQQQQQQRLVTLVQPSFRPHQLCSSDLHLMMEFLRQRTATSGSDECLWLPLCLPRFNSSGFLSCFAHCLDAGTGLTLALVSQDRRTEQFQLFRSAAAAIRRRLGIAAPAETAMTTTTAHGGGGGDVLQIRADNSREQTATRDGNGVSLSRNASEEDKEKQKEDVVDDGSTSNRLDEDDYEIVAHPDCIPCPCYLLEELRELQKENGRLVQDRLDEYLDDAGLLHFAFRMNIRIHNQHDRKRSSKRKNERNRLEESGSLAQCICPTLHSAAFSEGDYKQNVWNMYQKLNLRLRLGSANDESVGNAFASVVRERDDNEHPSAFPSISKDSPAMCLAESIPRIQGVTYVTMDARTYLAMNGQGFELYLVAASSLPVQQIAAMGAKLVRRLIAEEDTLFLSRPLTWSE